MRSDGRRPGELRPISLERRYLRGPDGSALVAFGHTKVLCTAIVEEQVPPFLRNSGKGWVTAEYAMLPGSGSGGRIPRSATQRGRALEISRLIGRSLRAVTNLPALGERQITVDCDVIQADGGTRTAAITGAYIALHDALAALAAKGLISGGVLSAQCAAVSVGMCNGETWLDLCYEEDAAADVDLNVVMTSGGGIIEVQGTAEGAAFDRAKLDAMLHISETGLRELFERQRACLT
jgi:ribonuclease PH